ncbi:hypothetical protein XENOCAPTIV_024384, partial [Xenoophorus captivus]
LKVTKNSGSFAFYTLSNTMDTLKPYQGKYICYATNELGTAVSNEAILRTDELHHIQLSKRVVVGKDGNLYFAHLTMDDSREDYTCNVQYLATRTILAKEPITLKVNPCEYWSGA